MPLAAGVRLGAYEVLGLIGAGGMGEVYKARDTRLDRTVAIKVLSEQFVGDPDRRARFEREARAVAALNHSHICALHDVGEAPGPASTGRGSETIRFLVMEYLEGQTLAERLLRGPLPAAETLRYAIELADALDHAHRRGVVHRDLKPGNVMLTKSGAKLLDFGLSKLQSTPDLLALSTLAPGDMPLTAAGAVLGTYPYMAPEQLAGRDADARSDIFAFGAMLHEMATGRRAFEGTTAATVIGAVLHTDPPPVSSLQPLAPPALDRIGLALPGQGSRRPLADGARSDAGAEMDRRPPDGARRRSHGPQGPEGRLDGCRRRWPSSRSQRSRSPLRYLRPAPVEESAVRFTFSPPKELKLAEVRFGGPVTISPDGTAPGLRRHRSRWQAASLDSPA